MRRYLYPANGLFALLVSFTPLSLAAGDIHIRTYQVERACNLHCNRHVGPQNTESRQFCLRRRPLKFWLDDNLRACRFHSPLLIPVPLSLAALDWSFYAASLLLYPQTEQIELGQLESMASSRSLLPCWRRCLGRCGAQLS